MGGGWNRGLSIVRKSFHFRCSHQVWSNKVERKEGGRVGGREGGRVGRKEREEGGRDGSREGGREGEKGITRERGKIINLEL